MSAPYPPTHDNVYMTLWSSVIITVPRADISEEMTLGTQLMI